MSSGTSVFFFFNFLLVSSGTSLREYRKLFNSINCGGNEVEGVMDVWSLKKVCFQIKLHILSWNIEACMIKMT